MNYFVTIIVTFFAGMGAGLGTGFAGMSAAAVITPMLVTFLGINPLLLMCWRVVFLLLLTAKIKISM